MADDKAKAPQDTRAADRKRELSIQEQIVKAVEGVTREKDGTPRPIADDFHPDGQPRKPEA